MWKILISVVASAAVAFLKWWSGRRDVRKSADLKASMEALENAVGAYKWRSDSATDHKSATELRNVFGAKPVKLPSRDTGTDEDSN